MLTDRAPDVTGGVLLARQVQSECVIWQIKCVIDSCKAMVPFGDRLRSIKYRLKPYAPHPLNNEWTIKQGLLQVEWMSAIRSLEGASVLEVGSGWQPLIPALYSLAGAGRVYLTDLNRLCVPASFHSALQSLRAYKKLILERIPIGEKAFDEALAWEPEDGLEEGFRRLRLVYLAPCDCRRLRLPASSLDVVTSRAVLEHIPPDVIQDIFHESFRLLKPDGLACHIIDNSDHWQHVDTRISRINFLKFSDFAFKLTCINSLNYQNRLRHSEYRRMFLNSGFTLLRDEPDVDSASLAMLNTLPIISRFRTFTREDLAATTSHFVARK
jgi:SAM-dependent methyltransferase